MYTDSHNHTCHFSPDAEMSISDLFTYAVKAKLPRIAITEHYDDDYPHDLDDGKPQKFDLNQFNESFQIWKKLCPETLDLTMGIELGYQEHLVNRIDNIASTLPFDSIILSNHLFEGKDVYFYPECYKKYDKATLHKLYVEQLAKMAEEVNNYNIIGHYDYINRYCKKRNLTVKYEDCPKEFDRLFEALISKERSLEINTRSIHKNIQKKNASFMPDKNILLRYKQMGGKMLTLGSDSHTTNTLGIHFEETGEYLKSLGFECNYYFKAGKPYEEAF